MEETGDEGTVEETGEETGDEGTVEETGEETGDDNIPMTLLMLIVLLLYKSI